MKGVPSLTPLPEPTHERWQPLRVGLVELYHYDVEEFWFRDGHLLLRGNNGTGKSKVLSLTLPFLLDANLSSARVEPDGDRGKRMEWNLLMNGRHQRRIGYTWMELGRRESTGEVRTLTLGCGLRAIAGRSSVDTWFFITDQRIGADLWLTTPERTALSRDRLEEAVGKHGQVFTTAQSYRRAVDERIFHLGTDRYAALVDTLIQLRQPQLSKQPNEQRLSDALTEALPPIDRVALEDVADAMSHLDDMRRELEELEAMRKAVGAFVSRYRHYAQIATRRRARVLRQAQTEFDQTSRELNESQLALERAREFVVRCRNREQEMDEQLAADAARLSVLNEDPVMRDAVRIKEAGRFAEQCRRAVSESAQRAQVAQTRAENETRLATARQETASRTRSALVKSSQNATAESIHAGLNEALDHALGGLQLPDGIDTAPKDFVSKLLQETREAETRRREQIAVIRKRLKELEAAAQTRSRAQEARAMHANTFDTASENARLASTALEKLCAELIERWQRHCSELRALLVSNVDDLLGELELWTESQSGPNPLRNALDQARRILNERIASQEAELAEHRRKLEAEQLVLQSEQERLLRGEDRVPPAPYTRGGDVRLNRAGAPLWQLVDFGDHVSETQRAGLEAALEASGLLDAWVLPQGTVIDPRTQDVILTARAHCEAPLSDWLVPTIPQSGTASEVSAETVSTVLSSIACSERDTGDAEAWVATSGEYRLAALRGGWLKTQAEYIGHAAREAARQARLAALAVQIAHIQSELTMLQAKATQLAETRQLAQSEYDAAPSDEELLRAHAQRNALEQLRRDAQARLGEADARLLQAENALARSRDALESDARDLMLPPDEQGIANLEAALSEFRITITQLSSSITAHQNALKELADQKQREQHANEDLESALSDRAEKHRTQREADEALSTLEATVGKKVEELLQEIKAAEAAKKEHTEQQRRARAEFNVASTQRAKVEEQCNGLSARLNERVELRRQAIEGLRTFALNTGLISVAAPDVTLPEGTTDWGIEAALTIARRAEQALVDVSSEEHDWSRIQSSISRDLTELQTAMSAQGHAVTAEVSDYGLVVRVTYQQRPERPDTLQQQIEAEANERRIQLTQQERSVLEQHLEKEIAANLQRMIQETEQRVSAINSELHRRPTSTGVRYRLDWQVVPDDDANAVVGLAEARKRLLRTSADAWSSDDRHQLGTFLHSRIEAERLRDEQATLTDSLSRALDYRRWHRFRVQRYQDNSWKPLSGPASSGERALGLTVPLFAAASSHYESAHEHAPRLVLLDEAFAGIDDEARASCMALIREFDLDFVMTSEREWGCYPQLPGLSICQLIRREGMDAVYVSRWSWDGKERRAQPEITRRFPERVADDV